METLIQFIQENIDYLLFFAIIFGGIYVTKYTKEYTKISNTYKVLIASFLFALIVYFINQCYTDCFSKYLVTYLFATSFYELFVKKVTDYFKPKDN